MIVDVHAHLDFYSKKRLEEVIKNAKKKRVKHIITNSIDLKSLKKSFSSFKESQVVKIAAGLYPKKNLKLLDFEEFEKFVMKNKKKIVALGEIGLDLHYTKKNFEIQKKIFIKQLNLARKLDFPVIIHTRKAEKEALEILEDYGDLKIVLHCFSGNFKLVKKGLLLGCYFSVPANIVRSEHFQRIVQEVPMKRILTETDSPYLSPFISKENEPSFIAESIKKISKIWRVDNKEVEEIIEKNYDSIFYPTEEYLK